MRYIYQNVAKDGSGAVISEATVSIYEAGGLTAADVYAASSGGSAVNSVTTDPEDGSFLFYVDSKDYNTNQKFKTVTSKTNYQPKTLDDIVIFSETEWVYYADAAATDQGVDSDDNSVADLLAEIGTSNKRAIVFKPGTYTWFTSDTITSNITMIFQPGAILSIDSGKTLTIVGDVQAASQQIFSGSGSIVFTGNVQLETVNPKWFGATGDGSTDEYVALQNAVKSLVAGQTLFFPLGDYVISTSSQAVKILTDGVTLDCVRGTNIIPTAQAGFHIGNPIATGTYGTATNLVTNGGFDSATTGWTAIASTLASVGSGQSGNCLEITRSSGSEQYARQALTTVADKYYTLTVYVKDGSVAGGNFYIAAFDQNITEISRVVGVTNATWNEYRLLFKASSTSTTVRLVKDNSTAGTMLVDTVRSYLLTSNVTVRNFNFKDGGLDVGSYTIWATYTNNLHLENVSHGNTPFGIAIGNDSDDECWNTVITTVFTTGDMTRDVSADSYNVGLFRAFGGSVVNVHTSNKNVGIKGGNSVQAHDCEDIHLSNIHITIPNIGGATAFKGFEFTRCRRCTLNGFSVNGGQLGLVANFGVEAGDNATSFYNVFSNGIIANITTSAINCYSKNDIYSNITTVNSAVDLTLLSGSGGNIFVCNNFTGGNLTDATSVAFENNWLLNKGIFDRKIRATITSVARQYSTTYTTDVVTLTASQINALETTPISVVAIPAAGEILEFVSAIISYDKDTAFTVGAADNKFVIRYTTTNVDVSASVDMNGFIDQANDGIRRMGSKVITDTDIKDSANKALELFNEGTGDVTVGTDSTVEVMVTYRIIDTNL